MSEEEMKVVDYWKNYMEILHWNTQLVSEHHMKLLLDLIEKQSKEIEELKQDRDEYKEEYIKLQNARYYNYISKDKIKAKIEEIEKRRLQDRECELALHGFQREAKLEVLQSLLNEEE